MERINPNFKSEKIKGKKMCCVCGCDPPIQQEIIQVGNPNNLDVCCGESCMDRYYEDSIEYSEFKKLSSNPEKKQEVNRID